MEGQRGTEVKTSLGRKVNKGGGQKREGKKGQQVEEGERKGRERDMQRRRR